MRREDVALKMKKWAVWMAVGVFALAVLVGWPLQAALAQGTEAPSGQSGLSSGDQVWYKVILVASIAVLVAAGSVAAAYAVAHVGSAALGAVTERPEMMGRSLIFLGLAEGIAIYGLLMAILLYGKLG